MFLDCFQDFYNYLRFFTTIYFFEIKTKTNIFGKLKSPFLLSNTYFMLEKLIYALTALLGFITLFIISFRFKTNRHINFYLILFFFLGNLHFLIHSLYDFFPLSQCQKLVDLLFYINLWPLLYLYFSNLVNDHKTLKIKELTHIIVPPLVFLFFFTSKNII